MESHIEIDFLYEKIKYTNNLSSSTTKTAISLTWDAVSNTTGYELEIDGKTTNVGLVTSYNNNGLISGSYHSYKVRARNSSGKSNWSLPITVRTIPELPSVPTNLSYTSTDSMANVEWDVVANADYYEVSIDGQVTSNVLTNYLNLDELLPETNYLVKIRAVNTGGLSEWYTSISSSSGWSSYAALTTDLGLSDVPTGFYGKDITLSTLDTTNGAIVLNWNAVDEASGYEIEDKNGNIVEITQGTEAILDQLQYGTLNEYRIRSFKSFDNPNLISNGDFTLGYQNWLYVWNSSNTDFVSSYSIKTDINGDKYLNLKFERVANNSPSHYWPNIRQYFDGLLDTQYILNMQYRINDIHNNNAVGGFFRLSPVFNDYFTTEKDYIDLLVTDTVGVWNVLDLNATFTQAQYVNPKNNSVSQLNPCIEFFGNDMDAIGDMIDLDIKLISVTEDASTATLTKEYSGWSNWIGCVTALETTEIIDAAYNVDQYELAWAAVENATGYEIEMDGVVIGETTETTYAIPSTQSYFSHVFRVRAKNTRIESEWSNSYYSDITRKNYTIVAQTGEEISVMVKATQVEHIDRYGMVLSFKTSEVEILDLCEFTPQQELSTCFIDETKTALSTWQSGDYTYVEVWVDPRLPAGTLWTGYMTSIKLRSKISGNINLSLGEVE